MATEIERKFLLANDAWRAQAAHSSRIAQGYLATDPTVRVRVRGDTGFLTIKGKSEDGISRAEFEYEIPLEDVKQLLTLCDGPLIEKYRRTINYEGMLWELDEFLGENQGLVVAEIELESESQVFAKPDWVGVEVTADARYYNSNLSVHPFSKW